MTSRGTHRADPNIDRRGRFGSRAVDTSQDHAGSCPICDGTGKAGTIVVKQTGSTVCQNCGGSGRSPR